MKLAGIMAARWIGDEDLERKRSSDASFFLMPISPLFCSWWRSFLSLDERAAVWKKWSQLSLYGRYSMNPIMPLQAILKIPLKHRAKVRQTENMRTPVVALCIAEKRRLRKLLFRQSPPRCVMVPLQSMSFADLDLPEMHFVPARGLNASPWTGMHLGEV